MNETTTILFIGLLALLLVVAVVFAIVLDHKHKTAALLLDQALDQVADLTSECAVQANNATIFEKNWETLWNQNDQLIKEIDVLRKDISEMEDEITAARARLKPFNPNTATPVQILAHIVAAECGPTSTYTECRWVAQVIVNRAIDQGRTIKEIVTEPGQFTPVTSGAWVWADPTVIESAAAWNANEGEEDIDTVRGLDPDDVQYFCAVGHEDDFFRTKLEKVFTIGGTAFYRARK